MCVCARVYSCRRCLIVYICVLTWHSRAYVYVYGHHWCLAGWMLVLALELEFGYIHQSSFVYAAWNDYARCWISCMRDLLRVLFIRWKRTWCVTLLHVVRHSVARGASLCWGLADAYETSDILSCSISSVECLRVYKPFKRRSTCKLGFCSCGLLHMQIQKFKRWISSCANSDIEQIISPRMPWSEQRVSTELYVMERVCERHGLQAWFDVWIRACSQRCR
jgi:hypothetical protein